MKNQIEKGNQIIIGKKVQVKAKILSIGSKIKIQREDKDKPTYIYEKDIIEVIVEKEEKPTNNKVTKLPKYIDTIIECLNKDVNTITDICKTIPSKNSKTGYIRPSQLTSSLKYLLDNKTIIKIDKTYKVI